MLFLKEFVAATWWGTIQPARSIDGNLGACSFFTLLKLIFVRVPEYVWTSYLVANDAELETDKVWAASRKSVCQRNSDTTSRTAAFEVTWQDPADSFLRSLSLNERLRLEKYRVLYPSTLSCPRTYDLGQEPLQKAMVSRASGSLTP